MPLAPPVMTAPLPCTDSTSDHPRVAQPPDVVPCVADLEQHLFGVLPQLRCDGAGPPRRVAEANGRGDNRHLALRTLGPLQITVLPHAFVGDDRGVVAHRREPNAGIRQDVAPLL